jgi:hypothetical protein
LQFEEDGAAVLVASLPPPVREQGNDFKAAPSFVQILEAPDGGHTLGAVIAYFDPQRMAAAVNGDFE